MPLSRGGGFKAIVAGPLKRELFAASLSTSEESLITGTTTSENTWLRIITSKGQQGGIF